MKFDLLKRWGRAQTNLKRPGVQFCWQTHPGKIRNHNEDSFLLLPEWGLWAVADGMGGHNCGEVASAIGLMALQRSIVSGESLENSIQNAHQAIKKQAEEDSERSGMGTTLVAVQVEPESYRVAWVGDSRAYLWRNRLKQLTRDHSYVQMLLDQGLIDQESAKTSPYRNVILQALGSLDKDFVQVDVVEEQMRKDDILLLCSDGLTGQVPDSAIAAILAKKSTLDQKAEQLLTEALANEADDNITLILLAKFETV